jgi:hypothetical protein
MATLEGPVETPEANKPEPTVPVDAGPRARAYLDLWERQLVLTSLVVPLQRIPPRGR